MTNLVPTNVSFKLFVVKEIDFDEE